MASRCRRRYAGQRGRRGNAHAKGVAKGVAITGDESFTGNEALAGDETFTLNETVSGDEAFTGESKDAVINSQTD